VTAYSAVGSSAFLPFLLLTLAAAVADWVAVDAGARRPGASWAKPVEYAAKPLTLLLLLVTAVATAHGRHLPSVVVAATIVALGFSLLGDVFLLLPEEKWFVPGLGAFLLAHAAYVVAFVRLHNTLSYAISFVFVGLVLATTAFVTVGRRILAGAKAEDPKLGGPVLAYLTVISLMMVTAWWTGDIRIVLGALLFCFSDAVIGWTKFIEADRLGPLAIIVTYHLAQVLLVLGLLYR
jgi:uncharacterized membrane protein YhhN